MDHKAIAKELESYLLDLRHEFHMHPEMPLEEKWTSARICKELDAIGIPYEIAGTYNVIGKLTCGEGRKIAIRADIDALPIQEITDVPWKSCNDGCMHACGHDAHTAILLATAKAIAAHKDQFHGTIYFVFQQAEELGKCADECVAYLKEQGGVDNAIGLHISGEHEGGFVELTAGPRFSGAEIFYIDIKGEGGHGSRPDLVKDPILTACDIYQKITHIPAYLHSMHDTCVVSPCMLSGGNRFNVFPDTAHIEGTIRYYKDGDGQRILDKIKHLAEGTARLYGTEATVTSAVAAKYPLYNHPEDIARAREIAEQLDLGLLEGLDPQSPSDNFAEFVHEWPGFYMFLGVHSHRPGTSGNHHTNNFDLDESVLHLGVAFFLAYTDRFLND